METIKSTIQSVQNALVGDKQELDQSNVHDNAAHGSAVHDNAQQRQELNNSDKPTQPLPVTDQGSRTTDGGAHDGMTRTDSGGSGNHIGMSEELEKTLSGPRDPALQGEEHPKMTGEGAPGSHSALFGLTPDGKKY